MRAVIQRVTGARVTVADREIAAIGRGLVVLLGVGRDDRAEDIRYLADKVVHLRIFEDRDGKMNRSVLAVGGSVLVVSQFTLWGDCRKGRRPSFAGAAPPEAARAAYEAFVAAVAGHGIAVATGEFQAMMAVELINDGPVTILLDSRRSF